MPKYGQYSKFADKDGVRRQYIPVPVRMDDIAEIRKIMKLIGKKQLPMYLADIIRQHLLARGIKRYEEQVYQERYRPARLVMTKTANGKRVD